MVAVQKAQRRSDFSSLVKTSTDGNADRSRHFQGFGAGHKLAAVGGLKEVDLQLHGDPDPALGQGRR